MNRIPRSPRKRIVLAGGGHAHLYSLRRTAELTRQGFGVTLVDPSPYLHYSGMATGVVSGVYSPKQYRIDVRRLVREGGGTFVEGRVRKVDREGRALALEDGREIPYDAVSFCVGSTTPTVEAPADADVLPVKPIENAAEVHRRLADGERTTRLLVVGGGAAGCEVAANAISLLEGRGDGHGVTVVERGASLLEGAPAPARRSIEAYLKERGARVFTNCEIVRYDGGSARAGDGRTLPYDIAVLAVGVEANDGVFRASGLPVGPSGGLWVDRTLRSLADGGIFGGGDCVSFRGEGLPKLGVFAIRQGPVLHHNLQAVLRGEPLRAYRPQKRFLYVLNLGDGTGLAVYGPAAWRGRLAWRLKNFIDRRFMAEYDALP